MDFRTFYGVRGEARKGLTCEDSSRTRQEFLNESLTSTILDRFAKTGILTPSVNSSRIAQFGDFSQVPNDLLDASTRLDNVRSIFDELPALVRAQFGNSPIAFVQFMADPANKEKAIELGLIEKPVVSKTSPVSVQPQPSQPSQPSQPTQPTTVITDDEPKGQ